MCNWSVFSASFVWQSWQFKEPFNKESAKEFIKQFQEMQEGKWKIRQEGRDEARGDSVGKKRL